jgi:O-antigen ligase
LVFIATVDYRFFANVPNVPSVTMLEIVSFIVVFLSLIFIVTRQDFSQRAYHVIRGNPMVFGYLGWITIGALINLAWSTVPAATLKDLLPGFVLFFFVAFTVRKPSEVRKVLGVYLLGSMLQVVIGASQVFWGGPRPVPIAEIVAYKQNVFGGFIDIDTVPTGLLMHPNGLALFILPVVLLLLAQIIYGRISYPKRLGLVLMLAQSLFVFWHTQVKGAFAWLVIGIIVLVLPSTLSSWRGRLGWATLVGGILTILLLSVWINQELGKLGTVVSRIQLNEAALAVLRDKPLVLATGGGSESMHSYSSQYSNMKYPSSHNTYLDQALLFGIPGLVLYIGIAATALRQVTTGLRGVSSRNWRMAGRFIHAAMIAQLGMFFFEPALFGTHLQATFLLFTALATVVRREMVFVCTTK